MIEAMHIDLAMKKIHNHLERCEYTIRRNLYKQDIACHPMITYEKKSKDEFKNLFLCDIFVWPIRLNAHFYWNIREGRIKYSALILFIFCFKRCIIPCG